MPERGALLMVCALIGWFHVWTTRSSSVAWDFGGEQPDYYNLLIDGWLDGQLHLKVEVPPALLQAENPYDPATRPPGGLHDASFYRGKYFLYFGAAPVVALMLPFRVVTGVDLPMPAAILVFTLGGFGASVLLWLQVRRKHFPEAPAWLVGLGVAVLGTATMSLVIARRANIWELPLSSGFFFAMVALLAVFRSLHAERSGAAWLAGAALALGLAVASRPTYLFAAPALLVPVARVWRGAFWRQRGHWLAAAIGPMAIVGLGLAAHNYARFGDPLEFGTKYMLAGANEAEARYFSAAYFGYNFDRYFLRAPLWLRYCPFLFQPPLGETPRGYYGVEEVYGVLPGFLVVWLAPLAVVALWRRDAEPRRRLGLFLIATTLVAAGPALVLCCFWAAMARYQIDFLPGLVVLGLVGALGLERWGRGRRAAERWALRATFAGAMLVSIFYGVAQSIALYGNLWRLNPGAFARIARVLNYPAHAWERAAGTPFGPVQLELRLRARPPGTREPLIAAGLAGREDRLVLRHEGEGRVALGCSHDGGAERWSAPARIDFGRAHALHVEMGSLYPPEHHPFFAQRDPRVARWWRLALDGAAVHEHYQRFHPASPATLRWGAAVAPRAGEARFAGEIVRIARVAPRAPAAKSPADAAPPRDFSAVRLRLTFPPKTSGREPLVSAGDTGRADFIFVEYLDGHRVRFGHDHWGKPSRLSEPVSIRAGEPHVVEIALGSFGRERGVRREAVAPVRIGLDGRTVWEQSAKLYPLEPEDVFVGRNPIGGTTTDTEFTGTLAAVEWVPEAAGPAR